MVKYGVCMCGGVWRCVEVCGEYVWLSENNFFVCRIDYGCAQEVRGLVHQQQCGPEEWYNIKFMVFDTPSHPNANFEERMSILSQVCFTNISCMLLHCCCCCL